jgi:hypothetical protein
MVNVAPAATSTRAGLRLQIDVSSLKAVSSTSADDMGAGGDSAEGGARRDVESLVSKGNDPLTGI